MRISFGSNQVKHKVLFPALPGASRQSQFLALERREMPDNGAYSLHRENLRKETFLIALES